MQSPILSIIVPIYNVKPYLRKCVDSLLMQDIDNYEIILVDDGSTDGSGELADELVQSPIINHQAPITNNESPIPNHKSQIIKVIHQANKGLSEARNIGIRAAQGKYIQFVDSDDYLEPNVLGKLVAQMEREELDVLRFDYQNVRLVGDNSLEDAVLQVSDAKYEVFEPNKTPRQVDHCTDIVTGEEYLNTRMGYACYAWQFIMQRTLLISDAEQDVTMADVASQHKKKMMFLKGIYFEDTEWTPRMLLTAKRVNSSTTIAYDYLMRTGSITKAVSKEKQLKVVNDKLIVIESLRQTMSKAGDKRWLRSMISLTALGLLSGVARHELNARSYIKKLCTLGVFPLYADNVTKSAKRKIYLVNFCPYLYILLMRR